MTLQPPADAAAATALDAAASPEEQPAPEPQAAGLPAMDYYHSLLEGVDPERMSVPLLMHCVLEQVEWNVLEERRRGRRPQAEEGEGQSEGHGEGDGEGEGMDKQVRASARSKGCR